MFTAWGVVGAAGEWWSEILGAVAGGVLAWGDE